VSDADDLALDPRRVRERPKHVHDAGNAKLLANPRHKSHGWVKRRSEEERHAYARQLLGRTWRIDRKLHTERLEYVGGPTPRSEGPVPVLGHGGPGAHRDHGGRGRDVERAHRAAAGTARIDHLAVPWRIHRHHRPTHGSNGT